MRLPAVQAAIAATAIQRARDPLAREAAETLFLNLM
jgi:hypothetical protein